MKIAKAEYVLIDNDSIILKVLEPNLQESLLYVTCLEVISKRSTSCLADLVPELSI